MIKVLKILGKSILGILEWILILLILLSFAIRSSQFQTFLAEKVTNYLSKELGVPISIDRIDITFIDRAYAEGVMLFDEKKDTLIYAKSLFVNLDDYNLKNNDFSLGEVTLKNAVVKLKKYEGDSVFNFQFLADYFKSNKPSSNKPFKLKTNQLNLDNVNYIFADANKAKTAFGMDYAHLNFKNIKLNASDISFDGEEINLSLNQLSMQEQSGFKLQKLASNIRFSKKGTFLNDLIINTDKSRITAPKFVLKTESYTSYSSFLDSVIFDAEINTSKVSMYDVSLFAPNLKGMNNTVELKTKVRRKVKNLLLKDLRIAFGKSSYVEGKLSLPDFRDLESAIFVERINKVEIDLNDLTNFKLPNSAPDQYIALPNEVLRLGYFNGEDIRLDGSYNQFVISADKIDTRLGSVTVYPGIVFDYLDDGGGFRFGPTNNSVKDIHVQDFDLGSFLQNKELGLVAGNFDLSGFARNINDIDFTLIEGKVDKFDFMDYRYTDILIKNGSFANQKFDGKVVVGDENLDLEYAGSLDLKGQKHLNFRIDVRKALLNALNLIERDSTKFSTYATVDWYGLDPKTFNGTVTLDKIFYKEKNDSIAIPELKVELNRGINKDEMNITSSVLNASVQGKLNFNTIVDNLKYQFSQVLPILLQAEKSEDEKKSDFTYNVTVKNLQPVFDIFLEDLEVADGTTLNGFYNESNSEFQLNLLSDKVKYQDYYANNISLEQELQYGQLIALYDVDIIHITDTLQCEDFHFTTIGFSNTLDSQMSWNATTKNPTNIAWTTEVLNEESFKFDFLRSYFTIKENRWDINRLSQVVYAPDSLAFNNFKISRSDQYISLEGIASNKPQDKLNVIINNLDLADFSGLVGQNLTLDGTTNINGVISTPFTNLSFNGKTDIDSLSINNEEVGDILVEAVYNNTKKQIELDGDLKYRNVKTFAFDGNYYLEKDEDNLDFNLVFDEADLEVVNAFMDPDVVSNIGGLLKGKVKVKGSPSQPQLIGKVDLNEGIANLALLGANFKFGGEINIDEYGIYVDNMPITDEEGHTGSMVGQVFHDNFTNFNFDLSFNLEDDAVNRDPYQPYKVLPLEKFLVMNTQYKEGDVYYGKAYVTGTANISGYADNMEIAVDVKSEKGTWVDFPMYGSSEITEENFIILNPDKNNDTLKDESLIDFTGVDMQLNIEATPDARLKLIFDPTVGDEITAYGAGDLEIKLDNFGDLAMEGLYTVEDGVYNFAMGPYKQNFYIQPGGTVQWTGNPYEAILDIAAFYKTTANISIVMDEVLERRSTDNEEIYCYLNMEGDMTKPNISFDIRAPKASEASKAVINRIRSEQDELNRQFFSLMITKRFQPLNSQLQVGGNGALDLLSTQINSILSAVSTDYKLNVALDSDELTGDNSYELGISKGFLDDRLILSGSFGVESRTGANAASQSNNFIGDVSVEYLLNESGNFRVNIFNESNDYSIIQDNNVGQFTQGVGLHYQEDFQNLGDFKLFQYIADVFRKKENRRYKYSKKKKLKPIPEQYQENPGKLEKEIQELKD